MQADDVLAEALCRIEFKLDLIMNFMGVKLGGVLPMSAQSECPACGVRTEYQVDLVKQVVVRKCGCGTGKVPPSMPLFVTNEDIQKKITEMLKNVRPNED